jgi:hypothetical protein
MTQRLGMLLVALAVIVICALAFFTASVERRISPLVSAPLPVAAKEFTTSTLALEPGYHYRIEISVDNSVPYAACLLGASSGAFSGDCGHHPSILDVAWSLRDDLGHVVASGASQGDQAMFGYGGDNVDVVIGYISVPQPTDARLTLRYRRSAVALAPLQPTLWVHDPDAAEGNGINELLLDLQYGAPAGALGIIGGIMLVASRRRSPAQPKRFQ